MPAKRISITATQTLEHVELSPSDRAALAAGIGSPFYSALLKLFEGELVRMETNHFRLGPEASDKQVRASLSEVRAGRILFERIQKAINHHIKEFAAERDAKEEKPVDLVNASDDEIEKFVAGGI